MVREAQSPALFFDFFDFLYHVLNVSRYQKLR